MLKYKCDAAHWRLAERLRNHCKAASNSKKEKGKIITDNNHKNWIVENCKKVLFSDESHFFVQGQHSRFVRPRKGEQLSPPHFNELCKTSPKNVLGQF